jgi:O-antigen/teichoic acid export membrane protein
MVFVVSELIIFIVEWLLITKEIKPIWQIDHDFIWKNINKAWTFLAIEGIGIFAAKVDIFLISLVGNELLIGVYGAMKQMLQPFMIVSHGVSLAGFPKLAKVAAVSKSQQKKVAEDIIAILLFMSLPFFISLTFLGQDLLLIVYKDENFQGVGLIFNLLAISVITSSFSRTFNYLLTANGYEKIQLIEVVITTVVATLAGILLISEYKLMGAAWMSVARTFANFSVLTFAVYTRIFAIDLWKILKLPLLVSGFMAIVLYIAKTLNINIAIIIMIDILTYIILVGAIATHLSGGVGALKQKIITRGRS